MKLRRTPIVILILVLAAAAAVQYRVTHEPGGASGPGSPGGGVKTQAAPTVDVDVIVPTDFTDTVDLTGEVSAEDAIELRPEVSGRVEKILFQEGRDVGKGQLLVKLADADLQARKAKVASQLQLERKRVERLKKVRAVDGVSDEDYESAVAAEAMRASELAEVQAQIEKTELRAPFAGRMGLRGVSVGAVVGPSTLMSTLTSIGALNVDFSVPERYISSLAVGGKLLVRIRGNASVQRVSAMITAIEPIVSAQTRTQRVRACLAAPKGIASGQFAEVTLFQNSIPDALLVPTEAVVQDMRGATVFRVRNGRAERCIVQLGARTPSLVHVTSGLQAGDSVITNGILFVKPGKPVKVSGR
jgi:membrane fusion protein (multidrug efflux system)